MKFEVGERAGKIEGGKVDAGNDFKTAKRFIL